LGAFLLRVDWKRRKIALENMRRCLPKLDSRGRQRLLRENYAHYGILALEILHLFSPIQGHYRAYIKRISSFEGLERWRKVHELGKGVLIVSGHMANWEAMAGSGSMLGIPIMMVTRHLKPEWLHKKIEAQRRSVDVRCVYPPRTMPSIMKALRKGESVGLVMDQYAPPPMGVPVPFFGTRVDTLAAVGTLAQRTGAGIVFCTQERDALGVVHVVISEPFELGQAIEDPVKATELLVKRIEDMIRKNPTQWLWVHRRFKNLTLGSDPNVKYTAGRE
jgi:KDO2-lipid IV(A) lauroyltransferase